MLFKRTTLMINYEDANRALDKAKPNKKSAVIFFPLFVTHLIQTLTYLLTYIVCVVSCERSQISTRELCHQTQPSIPPGSANEYQL